MTSKLTDSYSLVALLPMKANSERIKGKNFKSFCGKPLLMDLEPYYPVRY